MMTFSFKSETAAPQGSLNCATRPGTVEIDLLKRDWLEGREGIVAMARRHGIPVGALRRLAREQGWRARRRGRPTCTEPGVEVRQLLQQAWHRPYSEVAKEHAVSKQRVGQLVQRWGAWAVQAWGERRAGDAGRPASVRRVRRGRPKTHILTFRVDAETASLLELRRRAGIPIPTRSVHDLARALLMQQVHGGADSVGVQ